MSRPNEFAAYFFVCVWQRAIYITLRTRIMPMDLSPHMALLNNPQHNALWQHADREAVVPYPPLPIVRPEHVRVHPVPLGVGATGTAFRCRVWGSYECVIKLNNQNLRPEAPGRKQPDAYVPLLSVAVPSDHEPALSSPFHCELKVAKRLFEPFPFAGAYLTVDQGRQMALAYAQMQAHPGFHHAHRILRVELASEGLPMLFSEACDTTAHALARLGQYPSCASFAWKDMARQIILGFEYLLSRGVIHKDLHGNNMYATRSAHGSYHYQVADYDNCAVLPAGGDQERWPRAARRAFHKMKNTLFGLSRSMTGRQQKYERWLSQIDRDAVPDDAAFETRYLAFLDWVSGDAPEPQDSLEIHSF